MRKINLAKITGDLSDYLLLFLSLIAIFGALVYYFYALTTAGLILTLILTAISFLFLARRMIDKNDDRQNGYNSQYKKLEQTEPVEQSKEKKEPDKQKQNFLNYLWPILLPIAYVLVYAGLISLLFAARSDRALISPWQVVNSSFFWLYGFGSLLLILALVRRRINTGVKIGLLALHYFLSFAVALIVYKIGYGFDPFIHQATMELIAEKGAVFPKPPYYLGQYGLLVVIHKISGLSLAWLNKILVPVLAAGFLPIAIYRFLKNNETETSPFSTQKTNSATFLTILFLLILTFSFFIVTTPQNLSYLFLILTILAGFKNNIADRSNILWVLILALATAAIHPLTGLPALGWAAWVWFQKYQNRLKPLRQKIIQLMIFLFTALALPAALFLSGGKNFLKAGNWSLAELIKNLSGTPSAAGSENLALNFAYFFINNYRLWLILAIMAALIYFCRQIKNKKMKSDGTTMVAEELKIEAIKIKSNNIIAELKLKTGLLLLSLALLLAYLLSGRLRFNDLIDYEQNSYAGRILIIIAIFLLPFVITTLQNLLLKIRRAEILTQIFWLIFGLILLSVSLYASYPRFDKYFNSHGYSTSVNDLRAVKSVAVNANDQNAVESVAADANERHAVESIATDVATESDESSKSNRYIVLANQQVSAAALSVFGFNHYYQTSSGPLYFYPIPTGGPLYQYYLDMVYKKPDRETALKAMDLAGVDTAYLIINKYWHQSGRVINEAKLTADEWWDINGEVWVFRYGQ